MPERAEESNHVSVDSKVEDFAVIIETMIENPDWWTADELANYLEDEKISAARVEEFLVDTLSQGALESTEAYRIVLPD